MSLAAIAWMRRRLTPLGQTTLAGAVAAAFLGLDTTASLAYQVFTLTASLLLVGGVTALLWRPRLEARWRLPRHATAGQPFLAALEVVNRGSSVERGLEADAEATAPPLPDLPPGGSATATFPRTPPSRGRMRLGPATVYRSDALGLWRSRRAAGPEGSVLVLPRRYRVAETGLPGSRRPQPGGMALSSTVGESQEFMSLREYRPGDPLRKIHWRSWAKTGRPVVKELQDEHFVRHALALDTAGPAGPVFEEAVAAAASFAAAGPAPDALLDLLFVGPQVFAATAGRGLASTERLLEALASVDPAPERPLAALGAALERRRAALSGCILVLLGLDAERRGLVRRLRGSGVPTLAFAVVAAGAPAFEPEPGVRRLEVGKAAEALA